VRVIDGGSYSRGADSPQIGGQSETRSAVSLQELHLPRHQISPTNAIASAARQQSSGDAGFDGGRSPGVPSHVDQPPRLPGTFYGVRRSWKAGDVVEFEVDQRFEPKPSTRRTPTSWQSSEVRRSCSASRASGPNYPSSSSAAFNRRERPTTIGLSKRVLLVSCFAPLRILARRLCQTYLTVSSAKGALTRQRESANKQT
jgi:hypothetical protein